MKAPARGPRALSLYRSAADPRPPASVDAQILASARTAAARSPSRGPLLFAGAMAATLLVTFTARLTLIDPPPPDTRHYGLAEGQSRDYLLKLDPLTTGPGSQEGLP
jgi:hypothetical protein